MTALHAGARRRTGLLIQYLCRDSWFVQLAREAMQLFSLRQSVRAAGNGI